MVISTPTTGGRDAAGGYTQGVESTVSNVPVKLTTLSGAEAFRMGHASDTTVYRLRCPVRWGGVDITLAHSQFVTIDSVKYTVSGRGVPQGTSGFQTAVVLREAK